MKRAAIVVFVITFLVVSGSPGPADSSGEEEQITAGAGSSLHMAVLQGDIDAVRRHIEAGANLDERDAFGSTPLIIAVTFDRPEVARALIEAGADMEIRSNERSTPLMVAAFLCRQDIIKILLENGADRYARNADGATAFDIVASPFIGLQDIYEQVAAGLAPLGLDIDLERIRKTRPKIAGMLRPLPEELEAVDYTPLSRDDWKSSTPAEQGLDPMLVAELYLNAAHMDTIFGLLVVKNGRLIAEAYFHGASIDQITRMASMTKSHTSALTGIALEDGCLPDPDQKMLDFFPEVAGRITDPRKQQITVRHLLEMRGGYPWEETDPALWEGLLTGHYPPLIEEFPLIADPGTEFNYSNMSSNWLGLIVARACGTDLESYAEEHLFKPIGVTIGDWDRDADGNTIGCAGLHVRARDAAKFGLLYLNGGQWDGRQVVPAGWVSESLRNYSEDAWVAQPEQHHVGLYFRDLGYGYQWWSAGVGDRRFDFAWGHGGQLIVLLDDLDMVIVVTSYPFYLQHDDEAWRHEQANFNLVGRFINSLTKEEPGKPK